MIPIGYNGKLITPDIPSGEVKVEMNISDWKTLFKTEKVEMEFLNMVALPSLAIQFAYALLFGGGLIYDLQKKGISSVAENLDVPVFSKKQNECKTLDVLRLYGHVVGRIVHIARAIDLINSHEEAK